MSLKLKTSLRLKTQEARLAQKRCVEFAEQLGHYLEDENAYAGQGMREALVLEVHRLCELMAVRESIGAQGAEDE